MHRSDKRTPARRRGAGGVAPITRTARGIAARLALLLTVFVAGSGAAPAAHAQSGDSTPTIASVDSLREALAADSSINDEQRALLDERLNGAARDLELAAQARAERDTLQGTLDRSSDIIEDHEARVRDIQQAPATVLRRLGRNPELSAIEAEIGVVESQRADWSRERTEALDALAGLARTDAELRRRLAELTTPAAEPAGAPPAVDSPIAARIEEFAVAARSQAAAAQRALIELKLRGGAALNEIRTAKITWLDAAITDADSLLVELRAAAAASRESAGEQRGAETRRLLQGISSPRPELQSLGDENLSLITDFQDLSRRIEAARRSVAGTRQTIEEIGLDAQLTERRLDVAGLEAQLGDVMLSRLGSLPDPSLILSENRLRNRRIAEVSSAVIDTEQLLRQLGDRSAYLRSRVADSDGWTQTERRVADRLLEQRRSLLQDNLQAQNTLLRLLVDQNQAAEELARVTGDYRNLLTANLLWVRNYGFARPDRLLQQVALLRGLSPAMLPLENWPRLLADPYLIAGIVLLAFTFLRRRRAKASLAEMLGAPIRPRDESAALILKGLTLTLVVSLPLPLLLATTGRAAVLLSAGDTVFRSLGEAIFAAGILLFALGVPARLAARLGVGRRLLKWNANRADLLLQDLRWFRPAFTVAGAVTVFGRGVAFTDSGGALAAIGSLSMALILLLEAMRLLRSRLFDNDWILRYALRIGALLAAAIVLMHVSGQLFAAHLYLRALVLSIAAVVGTLLPINILQRFLIIYRLGLARKTREERRARESEDGDEAVTEVQDDALDAVTSLSQAYTQLLGLVRLVGLALLLWLVWSPALPALTVLDNVTLWTTTDISLPAGELRNITLSVLLTALVTILLTLLVTRHLPPLLNVLLLEWTEVTPGGRYAAGMLVQYLVIGVGFSSALAMLGFQWEKVQWLVAALGVGIGFGLQEIVANFISGLIVLFERPIRVGDIINAGGQDGTVVNINPRATVIETFEGKEVMIPNKELITNVVTNWSLTSSRLRIVVPVGIAYGSDVEDAIARLQRIAKEHDEILADPEPWVTFEDFGDNALILWLRCYALKDYLKIGTELRRNIYREFNAAGIGIAFPQRDVHLDASAPLPIRILRDPDGS